MEMNKFMNFKGFSNATIEFLTDLKNNNNKLWFESHRKSYEKYLLSPMRALVTDLSSFMLTIDPYFITAPAVNKTISRIYRDTRFSKDKSLYRPNMWVIFKRRSENWLDDPGYFFEIFPHYYRYGMGFYQATKKTMDCIREAIDSKPKEFLKTIDFLKSGIFELKGESYKRKIESSLPPEIQEWYRKKSFYLVCNRNLDETLFSEKLIDEMISGFSMTVSLYRFIRKAKDR